MNPGDSWAIAAQKANKEIKDARATGVIMTPDTTNLGLAERDYTQRCKANVLLVLEKGYHIWWCDTHYHPLAWCDRDKAQAKAIELKMALDLAVKKIGQLSTENWEIKNRLEQVRKAMEK